MAMTRKILIKQMNDAMEMVIRMQDDRMLRITYSDFDFERFIDKCRDLLDDMWDDIPDATLLPFYESH